MNRHKAVSEILNYLKAKAGDQKIRITSKKVFLGKILVTVSMTCNGEKIDASGCAHTKDEAALKATMEIFERFIFLTQKINHYSLLNDRSAKASLQSIFCDQHQSLPNIIESTSSGVAAHTSYFNAVVSAANEVIERHVVLKALALNIQPKPIDLEYIQTLSGEIRLTTFLWRGPMESYVVVIRGEGPRSTCYGFGCSQNLNQAIEKARNEVVPRLEHLTKKNIYFLFNKLGNSHFDYHLHGNSPWTDKFFSGCPVEAPPEVDTQIEVSDFWFGEYAIPDDLKNEQLYVVRAISVKLQPLFHGDWSYRKINFLAFEQEPLMKLPEELHVIG